jgi:hypothetical protein
MARRKALLAEKEAKRHMEHGCEVFTIPPTIAHRGVICEVKRSDTDGSTSAFISGSPGRWLWLTELFTKCGR